MRVRLTVAYLGCLPRLRRDGGRRRGRIGAMVATQVAIDDRPSALRYPRRGRRHRDAGRGQAARDRQGRIVREGHKIALLSFERGSPNA